MAWMIIGYIVLVVCVIFFSGKLGQYIDTLDQKTTMASAFIGGVLLAAVTSLPELFTSLTSVIAVGKPALVIGNILGSNVFNLFVLGLVFLLHAKALREAYLTRSHRFTCLFALAIYATLLLSLLTGQTLFFYGISLISVLIAVLYGCSLRMMAGDEDTGESGDVSPLTLRQVVTRLVVYAVLLVITSILITYASDWLGETIGLGATMAGALLLGIVTSLPEMISCFVLARVRNFNAIMGNIAGSCLFNFTIFVVSDLVYWNRNLYVYDGQSALMILIGAIGMVAALVLCLTLGKKETHKSMLLPLISSAVPVVGYVAFLILSRAA